MGYREIISPEWLQDFEELGEHGVQTRIDAGLYNGKHKRHAILFIKLCESEREPDKQTSEVAAPWHETWWGKVILAVIIIVLAAFVISELGLS